MAKITQSKWAIIALTAVLWAECMSIALDSRKFDPLLECTTDSECEERNPHLTDSGS